MDTISAREISGYNGKYFVTPEGQIISHHGKRPRLLKPATKREGYLVVVLHRAGQRLTKYVHRLVAEAFIPNPGNKPEVNHIDGNKKNNCLDNLEWCTHRENIQHAHANGLCPYAKEPKPKKLTPRRARALYKAVKQGMSQRTVAKKFRVSQPCVHSIITGKTWKHLNLAPITQ